MAKAKPLRYEVRELKPADLERGFLKTLESLSSVEGLTPAAGRKILSKSNGQGPVIVAVAEDGEVIGTTTLLVEKKFIHHGGLVGHIEDVAVRKGYEGMGVGSAVVRGAVSRAEQLGCYKVILDCKPELVPFYERMGFKSKDVGMRLDLKRTKSR